MKSWFLDSAPRILDPGAGFQSLSVKIGSGFQSLVGFWSKYQDPRFYKQNFPGFQNLDSVTLANVRLNAHICELCVNLHEVKFLIELLFFVSMCATKSFILNYLPGNQL